MKIIADENIPFVRECFSSVGNVVACPGREITAGLLKDADAVLVRSVTRVNADLLADSNVRFVGAATIGFEHVDTEYLARRSIGFAAAPGSNANSVAEYIIAALLTVAEEGRFELAGKSIGVIGVGNIGSKVVAKCQALGMQTLLNDPPLKRQTGAPKYLPLKKLLGCDFLTLHTPLTFAGPDRTFHLADDKFFGALRPGRVFLNTARGAVTDTTALKKAVTTGIVKTAVLDVWENEPNIDTELLGMVGIGTPHIAGYSLDGKIAGTIMIYRELCRYLGIEARYDPADFLDPAPVPEIKLTCPASGGLAAKENHQRLLSKLVRQIYDIRADDHRLRQILNMPQKQRARFFDELRRNYPVRREFAATRIILDARSRSLAAQLKGIGFTRVEQTSQTTHTENENR
jgi:erythronate-4-phosphate dehydrogenase